MADAHPEPRDSDVLQHRLPQGIRSRFIDGVNGLRMHVLEAGSDHADRPLLVLLHGFPELAFSWRYLMPGLAALGYRVVAPDLRGYGRTSGWDARYEANLSDFRMLNLVRDVIGLMHALGHREAASVIGHDFGSPLAAWCATVRPELFRSVVLMSAPFGGPPPLPAGQVSVSPASPVVERTTGQAVQRAAMDVHQALLARERPRLHYQWYYATPQANDDMVRAPQGLSDFLRAYYHVKSADAQGERPYRLPAWDADSLARLPTYYVMDAGQTMAQTVAPHMPSPEAVAACRWLPDADLAVYAHEYGRTGFQGGLHWYRCNTSGQFLAEQQTWSGRRITIPSAYIAGAMDWGIHQRPGEFDRMRTLNCTRMLECSLLEGAGHWVQQEQPEATLQVLHRFLTVAAPV